MNRIAGQLRVVEERLEELRKLYASSRQKKLNEVASLAGSVRDRQAQLMRLDAELQEIERAVPFIKEVLESDERKLSEASNRVSSLEAEAREAASSLESERSIIKQRIGTELGSTDRLMKKLRHESPKKYALLHEYIANPGNAFIADESLEIRTILEDLRQKAKKDDPERYEKVAELLRNIDFFDSLREQYKGLTNKINSIRESRSQELQPLEKEKNHLSRSVEEKHIEISQLLEKRAAKAAEKERLVQLIATEKALLAGRLQELMQREVKLI